MTTTNKSAAGTYKLFTWSLFLLLLTYLLLRAYFLEPLHDEVATFFYYIESGIFWGKDVMLDANNHLLNSLICHWIFKITGDHLFFLRLPNVLAFLFYFWGIVKFVKPISSHLNKTLIILGTTCIPFILEYFANMRGYGISLGLFVFSLAYIRDFIQSRKPKSVYIVSLLLCLTIYANLTFIISVILVCTLFIFIQWRYKNELTKKQHLSLFVNYLILGAALIPALQYAKLLKESGALYYGSLDGFWAVTGKTLAINTIFYNENWVKYASLIVVLSMAAYLINKWMKSGTNVFFVKTETILAWLLFGNSAAIILMAKILKVNYPEDRVGMYLIVLFLLLLGFILSESKKTSWLLSGMLFFPITFIPRINLNTSIFSPDDRMSKAFFNDVYKNIDNHTSISAYPLMVLTWSYHSRSKPETYFVASKREFDYTADIVLTKKDYVKSLDLKEDYNIIAQDDPSGHIAFKRKIPYQEKIISAIKLNTSETSDEYITIYQNEIADSLKNKKLKFHVTADITAENIWREYNIIVYSIFDKNQNSRDYQYMNERWMQGLKKNYRLNFNLSTAGFTDEDKEVRIYIWNPKKEKATVKNGIFELIKLE